MFLVWIRPPIEAGILLRPMLKKGLGIGLCGFYGAQLPSPTFKQTTHQMANEWVKKKVESRIQDAKKDKVKRGTKETTQTLSIKTEVLQSFYAQQKMAQKQQQHL